VVLPGSVRRILVLVGSGIGDAVFGIPALRALAGRFPDATLTVLGEPWLEELVGPPRGPAHRIEVIPEEARAWLRTGTGWEAPGLQAFVARVANERFDLAVQLHGGGRTSNRLISAFRARRSVGAATPDAPALDATIRYEYWQSEVIRRLEVVGLVGARPVELEPRIDVLQGDRFEAGRALAATADIGIDLEGRSRKPLAVLVPGAGDPRRRWPASQYRLLARRLLDRGLSVAIVGAGSDEVLAEEIADGHELSGLRARLLDLTGRISLRGLIGLASMASLVVGNDTGPTHIAAAVGAPTVELFWCGNLVNGGRLFRDRYRPVLAWRLDCPICGASSIANACAHDASFLSDITLDEVLTPAIDLLEAPDARAAPAPGSRAPRGRGPRAARSAPARPSARARR
jgi:ADP-heptose:LPS heptosyltransferase